jgi:hypothetical protein
VHHVSWNARDVQPMQSGGKLLAERFWHRLRQAISWSTACSRRARPA